MGQWPLLMVSVRREWLLKSVIWVVLCFDSDQVHSLPFSACTQNQFRPDQPFHSSYPDIQKIHLSRSCLNLIVVRVEILTLLFREVYTQPESLMLLGALFGEASDGHSMCRARSCRQKREEAYDDQNQIGSQVTKPFPLLAFLTLVVLVCVWGWGGGNPCILQLLGLIFTLSILRDH